MKKKLKYLYYPGCTQLCVVTNNLPPKKFCLFGLLLNLVPCKQEGDYPLYGAHSETSYWYALHL
jgi:hypothetical protein